MTTLIYTNKFNGFNQHFRDGITIEDVTGPKS